MKAHVLAVATLALCAPAGAQPTSVVNSPHNLSAGGPGTIRATSENEVCIFCHAPHNASPIRPLWNRLMPTDSYSVYTSRALDADPGQPTGASKMCLSCHDGTIALGSVVSREAPIVMAGGVSRLPRGRGLISTDLRDDHPVSFRFDSSLAGRDPHLRSPASLPEAVKLDMNNELQCTSCHDAHNNMHGDFLVMDNSTSQLCTSCHNTGSTNIAGHSQCTDCHQPHSAPSGPYLLRGRAIGDACLRCHDGSVAGAADVKSELSKIYHHDTGSPVDPPDPQEEHTSCTSCHEPHTMTHGEAHAPTLHPNFGRIDGINASGSPIAKATTEYEVCFKCHSDRSAMQAHVPRRIAQTNTRLEFSPSAVSYHPVEAPGRNFDVPSLRPGWTTSSTMFCSDCHASESGGTLVGTERTGTHGSNFRGLLTARYETSDFTSESASVYALCYQCHDRASLLGDQSFRGHKTHIQDYRTPCAACHDSHGVASGQGNFINNSNLINFATDIVRPDPVTGRTEFRDLGMFRGECFLQCHGREHSPLGY